MQNKKEYKINFNNQISALSDMIIALLLVIIGYIIFFLILYNSISEFFNLIIIIFSLSIFLLISSALLLHIPYYLTNKNSIFIIDVENKIFIDQNNEGIIKINFSEIEYITIHLYYSRYYDIAANGWPYNDYHYAEIRDMNGQEIIVTCLMIKDIPKEFDELGIPYKTQMRLIYPYIRKRKFYFNRENSDKWDKNLLQ